MSQESKKRMIAKKSVNLIQNLHEEDIIINKILTSKYFFAIIFCLIATIALAGAIAENKPLTIHKIVARYISALLLGFLFHRFLLAGRLILDKVDKLYIKFEMEQQTSVMWLKTWLYFTGFIGCIVLGLGMGTFGFILIGFVCQLSPDLWPLAISIYLKSLTFGFCAGNIGILQLVYKRFNFLLAK
jgi:hypothetical protein